VRRTVTDSLITSNRLAVSANIAVQCLVSNLLPCTCDLKWAVNNKGNCSIKNICTYFGGFQLALVGFNTDYKVFYHIWLYIEINIFNTANNRARNFSRYIDSYIHLRSSQLLSLRAEVKGFRVALDKLINIVVAENFCFCQGWPQRVSLMLFVQIVIFRYLVYNRLTGNGVWKDSE
jgi:hypothetical protein